MIQLIYYGGSLVPADTLNALIQVITIKGEAGAGAEQRSSELRNYAVNTLVELLDGTVNGNLLPDLLIRLIVWVISLINLSNYPIVSSVNRIDFIRLLENLAIFPPHIQRKL